MKELLTQLSEAVVSETGRGAPMVEDRIDGKADTSFAAEHGQVAMLGRVVVAASTAHSHLVC